MFMREFEIRRFLAAVAETAPFRDYCRSHGLPFARRDYHCDSARWSQALLGLPVTLQARIEYELAQVNELADADGNAHLTAAASHELLPPADIPGGAVYALWFLVHAPDLFATVFFHHHVQDIDTWRTGKTVAGLTLNDPELPQKENLLTAELQAFFGRVTGTETLCLVQAHRLPTLLCFSARLADRIQFLEAFSETGEPVLTRLRPVLPVLFAYAPTTGTVYVQSPLRSRDRIHELLGCFGRAVLQSTIEYIPHTFNLDRLKRPFRPIPDALDMEAIRVKSLSLQYPAASGRRSIHLDTRTSDATTAIEQLFHAHVGSDHSQLVVTHAEIQVKLRLHGRTKSYVIRLWQDRCNLPRSPLGERFRQCLYRWGLCYE